MPRIARLAKTLWCAIAGLSAVGGFLAAGMAAASQPLAGTDWQLVAIQSMDDAQGRTVVPQPERFTLTFATDGSVALRLDCNQGAGRYLSEAAAASGPPSGHLRFEGLAVTRALCLPASLDARVTRDLAHVRSYLLQDGKLFLSLMADGGILEWTPVPRGLARPLASDRRVVPVPLVPGQTSLVIRGRIKGREHIDHRVTALAGQRLSLRLESSNHASSFILLPPGSSAEAMASGALLGNRYEGVLPADGVYTVRVFLMRSAARRHESSRFDLSLSLTGEASPHITPNGLHHGIPPHAPHPVAPPAQPAR